MCRLKLGASVFLAVLVSFGCHRKAPEAETISLGRRYVEDAAFRRKILEDSLVNTSNSYSQLRLTHYREEGWGALPEWNPPVQRMGTDGGLEEFHPLEVDSVPWEHDALVGLGHEAFFRYPVQLQDVLRVGLEHPDDYGLWRSPQSVGGVVREQVRAGPPRLAATCATCHATAGADGQIVAGLPNAKLNLGAMLTDGFGGGAAPATWGPGRIDLTNDAIENPAAIPDLRPVRSERYLHHAATVRNGLVELAIRIETLIITANKATLRPPRKLTFALALYLWELQPKALDRPSAASQRGAQVFTDHCAGCHVQPDYSGGRVSLAAIGTDPSVGSSPERTTGSYRVTSLRGVGDRAMLLAAGQVRSLEELLDPSRAATGHRYGLKLSAAEKTDLIAFLRTLE